MSMNSPDLDERNFEELVESAKEIIRRRCPQWTDLTAGDPGVVLLEAFAYLTEMLIYRVNRLPELTYLDFLKLLGVRLYPPAAAMVELQFSRTGGRRQAIVIPRGTRVTVDRAGNTPPPIFTTDEDVTLPADKDQVVVTAHQCELVMAEKLGVGTGQPGQSFTVGHAPMIASTGHPFDLRVGVEVDASRLYVEAQEITQVDGKYYQIWREVENFANTGPDDLVYVVDRIKGTILFAPQVLLAEGASLLAAVPEERRQIVAWYRYGGGPEGNVAAQTLTVLKDPLPGVRVTNPRAAFGGQAAETLQNARLRGPREFRTHNRAVTAEDFEYLALHNNPGVARAYAFTYAQLWKGAPAGTVAVVLVPKVVPGKGDLLVALQEGAQPVLLRTVRETLDARRPMGIKCRIEWARYKKVLVRARVVVRNEESPDLIKGRIEQRLYQAITPLPSTEEAVKRAALPGGRASVLLERQEGWPFGEELHISQIYNLLLGEAGVLWVDQVALEVDEYPESVSVLAADFFQPHSWYAGSKSRLFRSTNDGEGWELIRKFEPDEEVIRIAPHPERPGWVAVLTQAGGTKTTNEEELTWRVYVTCDWGESWPEEDCFSKRGRKIEDIAWRYTDDDSFVLVAANDGLFQYEYERNKVVIERKDPDVLLSGTAEQPLRFYTVVFHRYGQGKSLLAVALKDGKGVYLCRQSEAQYPSDFKPVHFPGGRSVDIRKLAIQNSSEGVDLWAGAAALGPEDPGDGCYRCRVTWEGNVSWVRYHKGWTGGSCTGFAFMGNRVFAATYRRGVLELDLKNPEAEENGWAVFDWRYGLPLRPEENSQKPRFWLLPIYGIAAYPAGDLVMVGGEKGIYRRMVKANEELATDVRYEPVSGKISQSKITLPPTWLFCSAQHEINVCKLSDVQQSSADKSWRTP